jgi:hypothetical protein
MGIVHLPERHMYWSKKGKYNSRFVSNIMSRDRFHILLRCFHCKDTSNISPTERTNRNMEDPFWTVQSFINKLASNYMRYYQCGELIDIDEMCIPFQGRHRCICYNPSKPEKWHLKAFCLNDTDTGYLSNFYLYGGRDEDRPDHISASLHPIMKLTSNEDYRNKNHNIATDNWYTSINAATYVKSIGMDFVGTVRLNRHGLPKNKPRQENACFTSKKHERGEMSCQETIKENIKLYFTAWMDTKPVHVLSTYPPEVETIRRNTKDKNKKYVKIDLKRPTIIGDYNKSMGGTDKHDQLNSYYRSGLKTLAWQPRIYTHFLISTCTNASIIYRKLQGYSKEDYRLLTFIDNLLDQMTDTAVQDQSSSEEDSVFSDTSCRRQSTWLNDPRYIKRRLSIKKHTAIIRNNSIRKECVVCRRKIPVACIECNAHLCIDEGTPCWSTFHNEKIFEH